MIKNGDSEKISANPQTPNPKNEILKKRGF
jgi:hypothetical protein